MVYVHPAFVRRNLDAKEGKKIVGVERGFDKIHFLHMLYLRF